MTIADWLTRAETRLSTGLTRIAHSHLLASLLLLALCATCYGPGLVRLPPVDRTEVVYAQSSRQMLEAGRLTDPRYVEERQRHHPIGTFWLQMASAEILGPAARAAISTYRLPSFIAVTLAVWLTYWLLAPALGAVPALTAAALFATTPIAALQSQLAITEGIALAPAIAAQLALARIYWASPGSSTTALALLFWSAQGLGITLNALAVPILSSVTILALAVLDRRLAWLSRLAPLWGVPLMLALGSPWIIALVVAEGAWPFHGMTTREFLGALGGSQAMKFKALPLTFTLALVVGMLPAVLLLPSALTRLWYDRSQAVPRFLLAWLAGYLAYLELVSSKPALYSVQVLLPPAAAAVAWLLTAPDARRRTLTWPSRVPGWLAFLGVPLLPGLFVLVARLAGSPLPPLAICLAVALALALLAAAISARHARATTWLLATLLAFVIFLPGVLGVLLPSLHKGWATNEIAAAAAPLRGCLPDTPRDRRHVAVIGYREPSAIFTFDPAHVHADPTTWQPAREPIAIVDNRQLVAAKARSLPEASAPADPRPFEPIACVEALNFTRGCALSFTVLADPSLTGRPECRPPARFACPAAPSRLKPCS